MAPKAVVLGFYAMAMLLACAVVAYAGYALAGVGAQVLSRLYSPMTAPSRTTQALPAPAVSGSFVPTADERWRRDDDDDWDWFRSRRRSDTYERRGSFWDDDGDEDRPRPVATYRTVCVRSCDGFYWPISYATTPERFAADERKCARSCGGARLFVYPNPGGDIENMQDLKGVPYRQTPNAFLYRTEYKAACACRPQPWEAASLERHRMYALMAAARKGDKKASEELAALKERLKQDEDGRRALANQEQQEAIAATRPDRDRDRDRATQRPSEEQVDRMGLGARERAAPVQRPAPNVRAWRDRIFPQASGF